MVSAAALVLGAAAGDAPQAAHAIPPLPLDSGRSHRWHARGLRLRAQGTRAHTEFNIGP